MSRTSATKERQAVTVDAAIPLERMDEKGLWLLSSSCCRWNGRLEGRCRHGELGDLVRFG